MRREMHWVWTSVGVCMFARHRCLWYTQKANHNIFCFAETSAELYIFYSHPRFEYYDLRINCAASQAFQ